MAEVINPKVSVIIPVNNCADYLDECLKSIITQTYENIEILCVNNSTNPAAQDVVSDYQRKDNRVISINAENASNAALKNTGIDKASGMFMMFVEPTDYIEVNMVEAVLRTAAKNSAEITFSSVWVYDEKIKNRVQNEDPYFTLTWLPREYNNRSFSYKEIEKNILSLPLMSWGKIYNTDFVRQSGVRFPENLFYEDNIFFYNLIFRSERLAVERRQVYNHRINFKYPEVPGTNKHYADILDVMSETERILKLYPFYEEIKNAFFVYRISHTLKSFLASNKKYKKDFYYKIQNELLNIDMVYSNEVLIEKSGYGELYSIIRNEPYFIYRLKTLLKKLHSKKIKE